MRALLVAASLAVTFAAAGCINVEPLDGVYHCSLDGECPSGYFCDQPSQTCWKRGHEPNAVPPDMAGDDMTATDSPECHDGVQNGSETDVDCGGTCAPCSTGQGCALPEDCTSMLCSTVTGKCVGTRCEDGLKDGVETDVDCGGGVCQSCADGKGCKQGSDCNSNICNASSGICAGTLCMDGLKDGTETDVDCGGASCPHCLGGKSCDGDGDCLSGVCSPASHTCAASKCENGVKDPGETDVDCGGTMCPGCGLTKACQSGADCASHFCNAVSLGCVASQCLDGAKNGTETDVDCGGSCGNNCKVGQSCKGSADCASGTCGSGNTCVATQCEDGSKDGAETDKDCGGGTCPGCALGQGCLDGSRDCKSMFCNQQSKLCVADQCHDGAVDGSETDVDCGGPTCAHCNVNQGCKSGGDCTSTFCNKDTLKCVGDQCHDGFKDNGETDVDCGGGATTGCGTCDLGKGCGNANANCTSMVCNFVTGLCVSTACADGRVDGAESDVDCGGGTCMACDAGKICKQNGDCGSAACDFGPSPHKCVTDQCADHHLDGNETDVDCGGGTCMTCALGKSCGASSDCMSGYCDPSSHKCACGGVGQACCGGAQCTQVADLCTGAISCSSANICVQASPVTCPPATDDCHAAGSCSPSSGMCSAQTPLNGTTCNRAANDQCWVANTSTCSSGTCSGGTHVADRCNGNNVETCNNNAWSTKQSCSSGCTNGVCNVPVPTVSAKLDGSDVAVSWTTPASGITCTLLRSDNGGAYAQPAAVVTPCPATAPTPCNAYDRFLSRGSYTYELSCKDASGASASTPPTAALSPGVEICAGDWSTAVEVHTAFPDSVHDKLERKISTAASLSSTIGVAFAPGSGTNCAPNDHSCGTVFVASYDNDKVMAFDRRANDGDAASSGPEPPSASLRTLSIALSGSGVTKYQPMGVATVGSTVVVAMNAAPGFVAGYPTGFSNATASPLWYLRGTATSHAKLVQPIAVATDNGSGTGSGWIFVANSATGSNYTITGYKLDDILANVSPSTFANDTVAPFVTITTTFRPDGIAVDPANHVLYATAATNAGRIMTYSTQTGAAISTFQGKTLQTPLGVAYVGGTVYVVDNATGAILAYPGGSSGGPLDALINIVVPSLKNNAAGLVICN